MTRHKPKPIEPFSRSIESANDNALPGTGCVADAGVSLPSPELTPKELEILTPLIAALAQLAAKRLSATPLAFEEQ